MVKRRNPQYINTNQAAEIIGVTRTRVIQMLNADPPELRGQKLNMCAWIIERQEAERVAKKKYTTGRPRSKAR